jgi:transcriptional regulator with XRE-family HTH domain
MTINATAAHVADAVRDAMSQRRVSQTVLGRSLGMSQTAVSRRLMGEVPFDVVELVAIAGLLHVPLSSLLPSPVVAA